LLLVGLHVVEGL
jgi:hypothetical protein